MRLKGFVVGCAHPRRIRRRGHRKGALVIRRSQAGWGVYAPEGCIGHRQWRWQAFQFAGEFAGANRELH